MRANLLSYEIERSVIDAGEEEKKKEKKKKSERSVNAPLELEVNRVHPTNDPVLATLLEQRRVTCRSPSGRKRARRPSIIWING